MNNTLGKYIFVRKYLQRTDFCELCLENCKFHRKYFMNRNRNFISQKIFLWFKTKRLILPLLISIKSYLTLFWQCSCLSLIFRKRHFRELTTKSEKHVLLKMSSTKTSYKIYNIYNRNLRNVVWSIFRERERKKILATFLINIFFPVFYVYIQPSCSKSRMEYFNINIKLLRKLSWDRLREENY